MENIHFRLTSSIHAVLPKMNYIVFVLLKREFICKIEKAKLCTNKIEAIWKTRVHCQVENDGAFKFKILLFDLQVI